MGRFTWRCSVRLQRRYYQPEFQKSVRDNYQKNLDRGLQNIHRESLRDTLAEGKPGGLRTFKPPQKGLSAKNILKTQYMRKSYWLYLFPWIPAMLVAYFLWPKRNYRGGMSTEDEKEFLIVSHPGTVRDKNRYEQHLDNVSKMEDILNRAATKGGDPFDNEHWKRPKRPIKHDERSKPWI